jgi:hypothetical protein
MLVHGEKAKMEVLAKTIQNDMQLPVFHPPNGVTIRVGITPYLPVNISLELTEEMRQKAVKVFELKFDICFILRYFFICFI